jgi:3-phenylpropionate/trans-cinnamate dioxygenase ferredoxin reductase subunit
VSPRRIVVVGASLAGLRTVEALRRHGNDARITLIGDEEELPYDRPPLSKDLLLGKTDATGVRLTTEEHLADLAVDVRLGTKAVSLEPGERRLRLTDGALSYDDVVIATGSSPRRLEGTDVPGVHVLRTLQDASAIRQALEAGPRVAVIGGGFIGAEVASAARMLDLDVTIIDPLPVLMWRALGDILGGRMAAYHRDAGVRLRLGRRVAGLIGRHTVEGVRLADGTTVAADLVVVAIGTTPNTEWLTGSGLRISDGIDCDGYLRAGPAAYAVGDVARWYHPLYMESVKAEHWTYAIEHADSVAATLSGRPEICAAVPYVWSDQHGAKLQIAGRVLPGDEVRFLMNEPRRFVAITGSNGVMRAAVAMNAPGAFVRLQAKLANKSPWLPDDDTRPAEGFSG